MPYPLLEEFAKNQCHELIEKLNTGLAKEVQTALKELGYYSGNIDGIPGNNTKQAFVKFKLDYKLEYVEILGVDTANKLLELSAKTRLQKASAKNVVTTNLAFKIITRMLELNMQVFRGNNEINIVYLEGVNKDGSTNSDRLDEWNDRRIVIKFDEDLQPVIVGNWLGTTEPGAYYTYNPMNPKGAARIKLDAQFTAWRVGYHGSRPYEALVQVREITVCRDLNKDGMRTGDRHDSGLFAVNQHHGYDSANIGRNSAGCLVGQSIEGHREFMQICKSDPRYQEDKSFVFTTAVLDGAKL